MTQKKKNNIIIGSLCAVVLLMVVGYAAFQSVLNITGTSKVSSNWNILITNIETKNIVGGASNASQPTGKGTLTATFNTNLVSPGDSIEYDITVSNQGSLNAVLEKINVSDSNNPAIKFTTTGITEGDPLNAGGSAVLTVKVEYDNAVTSQPDNTKSELTVTLDYVQEGNAATPNTQVVYRWSTDTLNIGDSVEGIETTSDYTTLGKTDFLKHTLVDGKIQSTEVCIIKDGTLHCLGAGEYEASKTKLLSIFEESQCTIGDTYIICPGIEFSQGSIYAPTSPCGCNVNLNGTSTCTCYTCPEGGICWGD